MYRKKDPASGNDPSKEKSARSQNERSEEEICLSSALLIIRSGENTERMIREKLIKKGFSKDAVTYALERVRAASLTDDRRLLFTYVSNLAKRKLYGPYRIKLEVMKRFDRDICDSFLEDALSEEDFFESAKKLCYQNRGKDREFIARKLSRCGFYSDHIRYVLKSLAFEGDE